MSTMDLATAYNDNGELSSRIVQNVSSKKIKTPFPIKTFKMRPSILTELLEVSHIRSIRQIFISVLVLVFLQVGINDLFELGT